MPLRLLVKHRKDGCITAFAYDGRTKVGHIGACQSLHHLEVQKVHVVESHRRQKVGTALYTALAEVGCAMGKPLASAPWQRNRLSEAFWEKQLRLGRAVRVYKEPPGAQPDEMRESSLTVIQCPLTSLAGRPGRRR